MRNRRTGWILLGILFFAINCYAQSNPKLLFKVDTSAVFLSVDNLDNIYAVTDNNQLLKYNSAGKLLWNYSNKSFGKLSFIDVTDPMRILLFYSAIQQAVVLNNNLNEISRFNFGADASRFVTLIATANSNGFWIYDQQNRQLQKLGNQFNDEPLSGNIYQQTGIAIQPVYMLANDQSVFLGSLNQGIMQFDRFGAFVKTINIPAARYFQIKEGVVLYLKENLWISKSLAADADSISVRFAEKPQQASQGNKIIATLTTTGFNVYEMPALYEKK